MIGQEPLDLYTKETESSENSSSAGWCVPVCALRMLPDIRLSLQIEEGSARSLIHTFDVKKRSYFGNTSMESEISLLMANQTLVRPSSNISTYFRLISGML
jgi:hypothetical protein